MNKPEPLTGGNGTRAVAEKARDAASDIASTAKTVAREQVTGRVNDTKERAVSGLGDVAGVIRRAGDENDMLQSYASRAADGIEQVTEYFENKDLGEMVSDVERFARREPALFLGGAFALGLMAARFLKSSAPRSSLELDDDDFYAPTPPMRMQTAAIPRPAPMRETPRPIEPLANTQASFKPTGEAGAPRPMNMDPYPQQHTGVLDPNKPRGGEGNGSL